MNKKVNNDDCIIDSQVKTKSAKIVEQTIKPCAYIKPGMMVKYIINANSAEGQEVVKLSEIILKYGRTYYLNLDISMANTGDNIVFNLNKEFADTIDIRSITNGIATVIPLRNNVKIKNGDRLCSLTYKIQTYK